ncbi:hypothetical protein [Methylomonas methanica]|uniref:Uncharacterized protein n=1 Tax=Methylomonas methanica (strain DSM 25384 / MC09) TaxID=857087 RepID=G0A7J0_METMM|nr:hypothetical protein [Methylomonas methanica]AEG00660.1 hypothetical protein Metme_2256 [Methylomonas methanica MC09]
MKKYVEVSIRSHFSEHSGLLWAIKSFCDESSDFEYLEPQSTDYSIATGVASCAVLDKTSHHHPAIAITHKSGNTFYIVNIVPRDSPRIPLSDYNKLSVKFAKGFSAYSKARNLPLTVRKTSEVVTLSSIIRGKKSREVFERYLNLFPTSYHRCDIDRLDTFTCYYSRHSKTNIDLDLLKRWLITAKGWSTKDAEWCVNRIDIGLDILRVNRDL